MKDRSLLSRKIKNKSSELGFISCGIAQADFLEEEAQRLESWLNQNQHGQMNYMANHFDKRLDPRKLVDGAKSVISFLYNYFPEEELNLTEYKVSKYAYGKDYHKVIKKKFKEFLNWLKQEVGDFNARAFVDSAPVLEKAWAQKSGLGWVGKNSNLLNKNVGSFFFLGEVVLDIELDYDIPATKDYCGTCTRCIDACPTNAIEEAFKVNGSKCISYLTIELKENIPEEFKGKMDNWMFGCDVCQDVCPWNRFSKPHKDDRFRPNDHLKLLSDKDMEEITEEVFQKVFEGSPVKRTGFEGLKKNIAFIKKKRP